MPLYDYNCREHGLFHELTAIDEHDLPKACPQCHSLCARVIILPPSILDMSPARREAEQRNERSQHEPLVSSTEQRVVDDQHAAAAYGSGGGEKSQMFYTPDGKKYFPSMRPWMIHH